MIATEEIVWPIAELPGIAPVLPGISVPIAQDQEVAEVGFVNSEEREKKTTTYQFSPFSIICTFHRNFLFE